MKTHVFYEITKNADSVEGRGPTLSTGIAFTNEESAIEFAGSERYKPFAVMGVVNPQYAKHDVRKVVVQVFETVDDHDDNVESAKEIREKEKALEKLSQREKELLGLA